MARATINVKWDTRKLQRRITEVLDDYGPQISVALQEAIATEQFPYPVDTYRRSRRQFVPAGLRDIVDSGTLIRSQTPPVVKKNELTIKWTAPYSKAVLEGGYTVASSRGNYTAPARNWIAKAYEQKPFLPFLVARWNALAGQ